jgi:AraC family transcriptional regulator
VISALNRLVDLVEEHLGSEIDVAGWAAGLGTTEYHLRRMFSSLAGMPLTEYVRRRRMTVAAGDVVGGRDDLLSIAVRHGYGSARRSGGLSARCMVPVLETYAVTAVPFAPSPSSGSA